MTEKYLWLGRTRLLAVYNADDTVKQRFLYADGRMPLAMEQAGELFYFAYDQVGSLRAVTDASGNVVKNVLYDSFGRVISDSNPGLKVPFGFAGGLQDSESGLVRFGYRDYDPEVGRWTSKDPIGFEGGDVNIFSYVLQSPLNYTDPTGQMAEKGVQSNKGQVQSHDPAGQRAVETARQGDVDGARSQLKKDIERLEKEGASKERLRTTNKTAM